MSILYFEKSTVKSLFNDKKTGLYHWGGMLWDLIVRAGSLLNNASASISHIELKAGPLPAWDNRRGEEFTEMGPNFLKYIQHIFPVGGKKFSGGFFPPAPPLITGLVKREK